MRVLIIAVLLLTTLLAATNANAYFIRPFVQNGASTIDGLIQNGATSGQQSFTNTLDSRVDLNDGTVKAFLLATGQGTSMQAAGIFGDTLTFSNDTGAVAGVDMSFAINGSINVTDVQLNGTSNLSTLVFANFFVFDAGTGATYLNFSSHLGALIDKTFVLAPGDVLADVFQLVNETLADTLQVNPGQHSFDIFASLAVASAINTNPVTVTMDFSNTATFGINTPQNVMYNSQSGVFLDSQSLVAPVPVPPLYILIALSLVSLLVRRKHAQQ